MEYIQNIVENVLKESIEDIDYAVVAKRICSAIKPYILCEMPCCEGDTLWAISELGKIIPAVCVGFNKNRWGEVEVMYKEVHIKGGKKTIGEILYSPLGDFVYLTRDEAIRGLSEQDKSIENAINADKLEIKDIL